MLLDTENFVIENGMRRRKILYLAGPMRGIKLYNFPKFEYFARRLREEGFDVISPAEMDLQEGFDPTTGETTITHGNKVDFLVRDIKAIAIADAIALMPGWEESIGVSAEIPAGKFLGRPSHIINDMEFNQ